MTLRSRRWSATLLALLLVVVAGEPLRAHACAMHELAAPGAVAGREAAGDHAAGDHAAGDHAAGGHEEHSSADEHPCNCMGTCCASVPVRLAALPVVPVALVALAEPGLPVSLGVAPSVRPERLLPFANGPPAQV